MLRAAHERVALLALAAIGAHGLLLLPDGWLKPSAWQIVVPFTLDYRPLWTGIGVCAAYLAAALALSYYTPRPLPPPPPAPPPLPPPRAAPRRPGLLWSDGPGGRGMA